MNKTYSFSTFTPPSVKEIFVSCMDAAARVPKEVFVCSPDVLKRLVDEVAPPSEPKTIMGIPIRVVDGVDGWALIPEPIDATKLRFVKP